MIPSLPQLGKSTRRNDEESEEIFNMYLCTGYEDKAAKRVRRLFLTLVSGIAAEEIKAKKKFQPSIEPPGNRLSMVSDAERAVSN